MTTVNQVPGLLQWLLTEEANVLAQQTGFIERQRRWTGAQFVQTLVFGWMQQPDASLSQLQQTAWDCGCQVSIKSISTRLGESEAIHFMSSLLEKALQVTVQSPVSSGLNGLAFEQVVLLDSTQVSLPLELAGQWPGGGNQNQRRAGVKVQVVYEWRQGHLHFSLHPAVTSDRKLSGMPLTAGSLVVHDSGFLSVKRCQSYEEADLYWLARVSGQMGIVDKTGSYSSLVAYLQQYAAETVFDQWVSLTHKCHAVRLIAFRLPAEVVQMRQERLRADGLRRHGRPPSPASLMLCEWCVLVTNVPRERLSSEQALLLYRSRWQIELLFKLWKQEGRLDEWRTHNLNRIQTELFAKLLMLLVQHWLLVETCWQFVDRSLVKAVHWLRRHIPALIYALAAPDTLSLLLTRITQGMTLCRVRKRRQHPAFFQSLEAFLFAS